MEAPRFPPHQLPPYQAQSENFSRLQRPHRIAIGVIQKNGIGFVLRADDGSGNVQRHRPIHRRAFLENDHIH